MDIQGKTVWQVAAGDTNRNYADLCLRWDVIITGPGEEGAWPDCETAFRDIWKLSERKITNLRCFAEEIKDGDIIVLRLGTTDVLGVGIVVGGYEYLEEFNNIDGWDLQHARRVRWVWKYENEPKKFESYVMKFGDTVQRMTSNEVGQWITSLPITDEDYNRPIVPLPEYPTPSDKVLVNFDQISEYLFHQGVASTLIQKLYDEMGELVRIANWYQKSDTHPSEFETVAYLVAPLLRALGWTPQKMAIEWRNVDLALFSRLPREDQNLSIVVEAKAKGSSCLSAKSQAQSYAEQKGRDCQRLIVTDGIRYGVYLRQKDGAFPDNPNAYLNLTCMRSCYPVLDCEGARSAFSLMSSDWVRHSKQSVP